MKKYFYIAGPLTPRKTGSAVEYLENCQKFFKAEEYLIGRGDYPFNPARDLISLLCFKRTLGIEEVKAQGLAWLERCDAVALLPGWENSQGTLAELRRALELKKEIYHLAFSGEEISGIFKLSEKEFEGKL